MARSAIVGSPLLRIALAGAAALALFGAPFAIGEATAKVGVTSATDGDPLGKPLLRRDGVLALASRHRRLLLSRASGIPLSPRET